MKFVSSLINTFSATCEVLLNIIEDGIIPTQRVEGYTPYKTLTSFEFVFIMHLVQIILEISNPLCQALQVKYEDISNNMHLVASTKLLIQQSFNN